MSGDTTTALKIVMFTDQVDSTANMARRSPAEINTVSREQDRLTAEAVRQCRGTILKDTGDVEEAIRRALVSGGEYFANVWSDAGEQGQAVLRAIVRGESPPDFPAARVWLREHDVLNDAGAFAVPMVERWVREKA